MALPSPPIAQQGGDIDVDQLYRRIALLESRSQDPSSVAVTGGTIGGVSVPSLVSRIGVPTPYFASNYVSTPGQSLFAQESTTPPAPTGATGTATLDTSVKWDGVNTWKVVNQTVGGNIAVSQTLATPFLGPITAPMMFIPVYIPDFKSLNTISIFLSMGDATFNNMFSFTWGVGPSGNADKSRNGWHLLAVGPDEWASAGGAPVWTSTINAIRYRFFKDATGGNDGVAYFGTPIMHCQSVPQLLLYSDDVHIEFYKYALPIFDAYGLKVNLACAATWAQGNANYMQTADYIDAMSRGHEVCVHGINQLGVDSPANTYAGAIADVAFNQAFVRDVLKEPWGYKHYAFPNGRYWITDRADMSVVNYMRDSLGFVVARTTDDAARTTMRTSIGMGKDPDRYNILTIPETIPNNATTTVAGFKAAIDQVISRKAVGTMVLHTIGPTAAGGEMALPNGLDQVVAYIASKVAAGALRCPKGSEFYKSIGS